ncbi:MAG: zf-HC2 domain-containing protein [Acidobacteria bacterium]|nr:zf-HC2 domain-containing protein [Acidobacteriota bacterium]
MKCEECSALIEEYVDGELSGREAERLTAHLALCAACAQEVDELVREQELYARYQREVEVAPAMWQQVRARIEEEKEQEARSSNTSAGWRGWLAETFGARALLRPAFTMALVIIALGLAAFAVYRSLNTRRTQPTAVAIHNAQPLPPFDIEVTPEAPEKAATAAAVAPASAKRPELIRASAKSRGSVTKQPAPENSRSLAETLAEVEQRAALVAARDEQVAGAPEQPLDPDMELARHVEKAQLLLRSFRNVRLAETSHAPDISYEKEQARRLLYRNIILRHDAAEQRNTANEKLLAALEPILLDIANLPDHPADADIRSIEQRMRQKEIMTALQVHSLMAQN